MQRKKCRERLHPALLQSQFNATAQTARPEQQMMIKSNRNIVAGPPMKQQQQQHQRQQQMQGGPGQVLMQRPHGNMQQQHMVGFLSIFFLSCTILICKLSLEFYTII
jgi:hypothetical protein